MSDVQAHILASGRVQGVGYRWFVQRQARLRGLTGWVKNRADGKVEVLAEGSRGLIETLIADMKVGPPSAHITNINLKWAPFTGRYQVFDITF